MANPSNGRLDRYSTLIRRNSRSTPPCTTAYMACFLLSRRCARRLRASQRWLMYTDFFKLSGSMAYGGSSSRGMMMSAPSAFCAATEDSGVSATSRPSR